MDFHSVGNTAVSAIVRLTHTIVHKVVMRAANAFSLYRLRSRSLSWRPCSLQVPFIEEVLERDFCNLVPASTADLQQQGYVYKDVRAKDNVFSTFVSRHPIYFFSVGRKCGTRWYK